MPEKLACMLWCLEGEEGGKGAFMDDGIGGEEM